MTQRHLFSNSLGDLLLSPFPKVAEDLSLVCWWGLGMKRVVVKHVHMNTKLEDIKDKDGQKSSGIDSV